MTPVQLKPHPRLLVVENDPGTVGAAKRSRSKVSAVLAACAPPVEAQARHGLSQGGLTCRDQRRIEERHQRGINVHKHRRFGLCHVVRLTAPGPLRSCDLPRSIRQVLSRPRPGHRRRVHPGRDAAARLPAAPQQIGGGHRTAAGLATHRRGDRPHGAAVAADEGAGHAGEGEGVVGLAFAAAVDNVSLRQPLPQVAAVVAFVGVKPAGPASAGARRDRVGGMSCTSGTRALLSWTLVSDIPTGRGRPVRSVIRWVFEPRLPRSTEFGPVRSPFSGPACSPSR